MRWWRRDPPDLPADDENGTSAELVEFARQAKWRAQSDRRRVERVAPRIAELSEEEFVSRVAALFGRPRLP